MKQNFRSEDQDRSYIFRPWVKNRDLDPGIKVLYKLISRYSVRAGLTDLT